MNKKELKNLETVLAESDIVENLYILNDEVRALKERMGELVEVLGYEYAETTEMGYRKIRRDGKRNMFEERKMTKEIKDERLTLCIGLDSLRALAESLGDWVDVAKVEDDMQIAIKATNGEKMLDILIVSEEEEKIRKISKKK